MSFPSVVAVAKQRGVDLTSLTDESVARDILAEAIRLDCGDAVRYLHERVHEADAAGTEVVFSEDPNSQLGKQLMRLFAADAVRSVVREKYLHGREIVFYNCCGGILSPRGTPAPIASALTQIHFQDGQIAYADC